MYAVIVKGMVSALLSQEYDNNFRIIADATADDTATAAIELKLIFFASSYHETV